MPAAAPAECADGADHDARHAGRGRVTARALRGCVVSISRPSRSGAVSTAGSVPASALAHDETVAIRVLFVRRRWPLVRRSWARTLVARDCAGVLAAAVRSRARRRSRDRLANPHPVHAENGSDVDHPTTGSRERARGRQTARTGRAAPESARMRAEFCLTFRGSALYDL